MPETKKNPTANMLRLLLAQSENPLDMRLNTALTEMDIVETIRLAIECLEMENPK